MVQEKYLIFVEPACGKARHSCYNFAKVNVRAFFHPSIQICTGNNCDITGWILKLFDTVVVLEEEKCHIKHF